MTESLADRAARLARETEAARRERFRGERTRRDAESTLIFTGQVALALRWIWRTLVRPPLGALRRPGGWLWRRYRRLWSAVVYREEGGDLVFTRWRGGAMLLVTAFFFWFVLFDAIDLAWDCVVYATTAKVDETVYLQGSQEIDHRTGAHAIKGCSHLPCSDDDAIYFRTAGGWFNNLWSLAHGHGLFWPEYVAAAVPFDTSRCAITSYGFRFRFLRYVNVFPDLIAVRCEPAQHGGPR